MDKEFVINDSGDLVREKQNAELFGTGKSVSATSQPCVGNIGPDVGSNLDNTELEKTMDYSQSLVGEETTHGLILSDVKMHDSSALTNLKRPYTFSEESAKSRANFVRTEHSWNELTEMSQSKLPWTERDLESKRPCIDTSDIGISTENNTVEEIVSDEKYWSCKECKKSRKKICFSIQRGSRYILPSSKFYCSHFEPTIFRSFSLPRVLLVGRTDAISEHLENQSITEHSVRRANEMDRVNKNDHTSQDRLPGQISGDICGGELQLSSFYGASAAGSDIHEFGIDMTERWRYDTGKCVDASPLVVIDTGKCVDASPLVVIDG
jgi:hypothetical protein